MTGSYRKVIAGAFRTAFDWHVARCGPEDPSSTMTLAHIISLVDDLIELEQLEEAVNIIRRGQRWLQGRREQTKWDAMDDDREYDPPDVSRVGDDEADELQTEEHDAGYALETPLRHRLAVLRLRLGDDSEAEVRCRYLLNPVLLLTM